jgi:4-hydroxybenzoate polyprenyltransferase
MHALAENRKPKTENRMQAYLQLIRLPNVLTAAADSLAGWLLVEGSLAQPGRWLPIVSASMVLYAAGTTLNDLFDLDVDRAERPGRPLPSGRASTAAAAWLGGLGLVFGPVLALAGGSIQAAAVAVLLAIAILAYDAGMKHTWLGPAFMGACRGLNLLLGMAHAPRLGGGIAWCAAAAYGLYVAGITVISRFETHEGERRGLVAGLTILDLALLGLGGVAMAHRAFPNPTSDRPLIPLEGILAIALIALVVNQAATAAIKQPTPRSIQKTVKTSILSLVWLNVGLVAAVRGIAPASVVAAFWVPAYLLGRWLYST